VFNPTDVELIPVRKLELNPMNCGRISSLLVVVSFFSSHTCAQSNPGVQGKSPATPVSVTLFMDWSRGDSHYGPNFIQLRKPCPSEKPCECVAEFKVISSKENSKEFAEYVTSFDHGKVPVTYQVSYNSDGLVSAAQFEKLGSWTRDKLHPNDGLLGVKIKSHIGGPRQTNSMKINSPGDCFPKNIP
jgi:hypothetical protein